MLLLIAVVMLFAWLGDVTDEKLGEQTCLDNQAIGKQTANAIESAVIRRIQDADDPDRKKLESILSHVELPNAGFLWIINAETGKLICHYSADQRSNVDDLTKLRLRSMSEEHVGTFLENISNATDNRSISGKVILPGGEYLVNGQYLPQLNSILVIGQHKLLAGHALQASLSKGKDFVFAGTLLLGLIATCLTIVLVSRINEDVTILNDGLEKKVSNSARELVRTKNAVIFGLAKLAESRDNDTGEHLDRIRVYVTILAKDLKQYCDEIDDDLIHNLALASSLHDIGKVGIPDSILLKPGRLTPEERGIIELHTLIGGECLDAIHARLGDNAFMHIARQVAYYHHEKWDGTGYPHALKADEIPLVARIVAVADVYDALTSQRPYKKPMSHIQSRSIIVEGRGLHFDPQIVDAFLRHEDEFEEIAVQQQSVSIEEATSSFQRLCDSLNEE